MEEGHSRQGEEFRNLEEPANTGMIRKMGGLGGGKKEPLGPVRTDSGETG